MENCIHLAQGRGWWRIPVETAVNHWFHLNANFFTWWTTIRFTKRLLYLVNLTVWQKRIPLLCAEESKQWSCLNGRNYDFKVNFKTYPEYLWRQSCTQHSKPKRNNVSRQHKLCAAPTAKDTTAKDGWTASRPSRFTLEQSTCCFSRSQYIFMLSDGV